jgi:endonuclease-3
MSSPKHLRNAQILAVDRRLKRLYGEPRKPRRDGVTQLGMTMLSQATTDVQTGRSFAELRRRFPTWEAVRDAPALRIADAIRSSGLSRQKAPRIKKALQHITRERGRIDLSFLKRMPTDEALRWLTRIKGVGPKTASIVLLFTYGKPLFPVDSYPTYRQKCPEGRSRQFLPSIATIGLNLDKLSFRCIIWVTGHPYSWSARYATLQILKP